MMNDRKVLAVRAKDKTIIYPKNINNATKTLNLSRKCIINALSSATPFYNGYFWYYTDLFHESMLEYLDQSGNYMPGFYQNFYRFVINKYIIEKDQQN